MKKKMFPIILILLTFSTCAFAGTTIDGAQIESTNILTADQINMNPQQQEPPTYSEGSLYWDSLGHSLRGYDGISWQDFQMGSLTQDPWTGTNNETMDNLTDGYITFSGNNTLKLKLDNLNDVTIESQNDLILSSVTGNIIAKPKLIFGDPSTGFGELKINESGDLEALSPWGFTSRKEHIILGNDGEDAAIEVYADAGSTGAWTPWFELRANKQLGKVEYNGDNFKFASGDVEFAEDISISGQIIPPVVVGTPQQPNGLLSVGKTGDIQGGGIFVDMYKNSGGGSQSYLRGFGTMVRNDTTGQLSQWSTYGITAEVYDNATNVGAADVVGVYTITSAKSNDFRGIYGVRSSVGGLATIPPKYAYYAEVGGSGTNEYSFYGASGTLYNAQDVTIGGKLDMSGEIKVKVYSQDNEPILGGDNFMAIWIDTNDSNRVYLLFRRGTGDQVAAELS